MRKSSALAAIIGIAMMLAFVACDKKSEKAPEGAAPGGGIAWMGYTEGMAKAKASGKPVMVDFYTEWCKYCKDLDATTYKDPAIVEILNREFVSIKVNAEGSAGVTEDGKQMTERDLAGAFQVTGFPTLWFFDQKGERIGALPGYQSAQDLKPVLTYITSGSYSKGMKYEDYLKSVK